MPLFVQTAMVKNMDAESIHKLGVNLTPEHVARQIFNLATTPVNLFTPTHRPIGIKTKILFGLSSLSPQFVNRLSNLWIAKK